MKPWRYLYYADADYGDAMAESFIAQVAYSARTEPGAAVFRQRLPGGAAHYYFAPAAGHVAERFFALPCSAPDTRTRGDLLAGTFAEPSRAA